MSNKFVFKPDTNIQKALDIGDKVRDAFKRLGLKCVDCVAADVEDLNLAALYHEKKLDDILTELNRLGVEEPPPSQEEKPEVS